MPKRSRRRLRERGRPRKLEDKELGKTRRRPERVKRSWLEYLRDTLSEHDFKNFIRLWRKLHAYYRVSWRWYKYYLAKVKRLENMLLNRPELRKVKEIRERHEELSQKMIKHMLIVEMVKAFREVMEGEIIDMFPQMYQEMAKRTIKQLTNRIRTILGLEHLRYEWVNWTFLSEENIARLILYAIQGLIQKMHVVVLTVEPYTRKYGRRMDTKTRFVTIGVISGRTPREWVNILIKAWRDPEGFVLEHFPDTYRELKTTLGIKRILFRVYFRHRRTIRLKY